VVKIP